MKAGIRLERAVGALLRLERQGRRTAQPRVKKAPFVVLIGANMPSVLAEISFVSNPNDERKLQRPDYRRRSLSRSIAAIAKYVGGLSGVKAGVEDGPGRRAMTQIICCRRPCCRRLTSNLIHLQHGLHHAVGFLRVLVASIFPSALGMICQDRPYLFLQASRTGFGRPPCRSFSHNSSTFGLRLRNSRRVRWPG